MGMIFVLIVALIAAFVAGLVFSRIGWFKKAVDKGAEILTALKK